MGLAAVQQPGFASAQDVAAFEAMGLERAVPAHSTLALIQRTARLHGARPAITYLPSGHPDDAAQTLTYAQLLARIVQCANGFHTLGVGPRDVVAFLLPALPETFVTLLGAQAAGVACPINPMLNASHIVALLRAVDAKVLVALGPDEAFNIAEKLPEIRESLPHLKIVQIGDISQPGALDFAQLLDGQPSELAFSREIASEDTAALFHTGGTTGAPKLVRHSHGNEVTASYLMGLAYGFSPSDVVLNGFPLFHVAGAFCHGLAELAYGACILMPSRLGMRNQTFVRNHWRVVERHRVSILTGGPTFLTTLLNGALCGEDISSARVLITGGSPLPPDLATAFEQRFGVPVRSMFGMTEACGVVSVEPLSAPRVAHSCGWPLPFSQARVLALDPARAPDIDAPLPAGVTGQLAIRGAQICGGYTDPARSTDCFLPGGWLLTGDVGHVGADGRIFITGRAKDVIIRSGHNIDPAVIEEALLQHPAVELCAAVAQPDPYAGELPVAFVQLRPGAVCTPDELMDMAREHIPERPAYPKRIWFVERFAMTATGKIQKADLRRIAAETTIGEALAMQMGERAQTRVRGLAGDSATRLHIEAPGADDALLEEIRACVASFRLDFDLEAHE